jgi:hypothetical protein
LVNRQRIGLVSINYAGLCRTVRSVRLSRMHAKSPFQGILSHLRGRLAPKCTNAHTPNRICHSGWRVTGTEGLTHTPAGEKGSVELHFALPPTLPKAYIVYDTRIPGKADTPHCLML